MIVHIVRHDYVPYGTDKIINVYRTGLLSLGIIRLYLAFAPNIKLSIS